MSATEIDQSSKRSANDMYNVGDHNDFAWLKTTSDPVHGSGDIIHLACIDTDAGAAG